MTTYRRFVPFFIVSCLSANTATSAIVQPAATLAPERFEQGVRLIVTDLEGAASTAQPIYLAGTMNRWNPDDPSHRLTKLDDGRWIIDLPQFEGDGRLEFKFTLGSWESEELTELGEPVQNRRLPLLRSYPIEADRPLEFELTIAGFATPGPRADFQPYDPMDTSAASAEIVVERIQPASDDGNVLSYSMRVGEQPTDSGGRIVLLAGRNAFIKPDVEWATEMHLDERISELENIGVASVASIEWTLPLPSAPLARADKLQAVLRGLDDLLPMDQREPRSVRDPLSNTFVAAGRDCIDLVLALLRDEQFSGHVILINPTEPSPIEGTLIGRSMLRRGTELSWTICRFEHPISAHPEDSRSNEAMTANAKSFAGLLERAAADGVRIDQRLLEGTPTFEAQGDALLDLLRQ